MVQSKSLRQNRSCIDDHRHDLSCISGRTTQTAHAQNSMSSRCAHAVR